MAEGEIVGLLDHDDTLEPNALYEVVKALQDKDVDVVYTDEDKILGPDWKNVNPNFKPDFNIDLLRSYNYITHFIALKLNLLRKLVVLAISMTGHRITILFLEQRKSS